MIRPRLPRIRAEFSGIPRPEPDFLAFASYGIGSLDQQAQGGRRNRRLLLVFFEYALSKSVLAQCKLRGDSKGVDALSEFRERIEAAIPALRRYARALTRDAETADDIVQDTLVRALRSEHLFHGGDMRAWLYTILTNLNRNRLRTLARRPVVTPIKDTDATASGPDSGGRDIVRALEMLTEEQRSALLLVVLESLTYREVSEVQGVPIGTVMSRLARARNEIKAYLDGERPALRRVK
jgi:RNA polymerase sigma-70 factor (ECF subfamily)